MPPTYRTSPVVTSPVLGDAARMAQKWRSTARYSRELTSAVKKLGARVRQLRTTAGLTQEQLAAKARLDGKHVQTIERGIGNPTLATLLALARGLSCKVSILLID